MQDLWIFVINFFLSGIWDFLEFLVDFKGLEGFFKFFFACLTDLSVKTLQIICDFLLERTLFVEFFSENKKE